MRALICCGLFELISWVWLQHLLGRKCARGKAGKSRDSLSVSENCERIRSKVQLGNESRTSSPGSSCSDKDDRSRPESLVLVRAKVGLKIAVLLTMSSLTAWAQLTLYADRLSRRKLKLTKLRLT